MQVDSFECYVGGLPKTRKKPFEYKAPFSPIDVIEEYTRPARLKENGAIVTKQALTEIELMEFDEIGTLNHLIQMDCAVYYLLCRIYLT